MSKRNSNGYGKGTFIDTKMFLSEAFLSLGQSGTSPCISSVSVQVLIMFLGKRQFGRDKDRKGQVVQVRTDENRFTLTYKELLTYGSRMDRKGGRVKGIMTQPKATRAIDELLAKGFIKIVEYGGAYDKHKSVYALVDDWMNWKVGDHPIRIRQKERQRGYQGQGLGAVKQNTAHTNVTTHTHMNVAHPKGGHTHERCTPQNKPKLK